MEHGDPGTMKWLIACWRSWQQGGGGQVMGKIRNILNAFLDNLAASVRVPAATWNHQGAPSAAF